MQVSLFHAHQELAACRNDLQESQLAHTILQQNLLECQQDLTSSQLMLLESQQNVRDRDLWLGNIFDILRKGNTFTEAHLKDEGPEVRNRSAQRS
jgi:hypothetical protein